MYIDATMYGINSGKNILVNNGKMYIIGASSAITASTTGYGIYSKDEMTLGTKITINDTNDFDVSATNNWFGISNKS